jgi:hypothetical protein
MTNRVLAYIVRRNDLSQVEAMTILPDNFDRATTIVDINQQSIVLARQYFSLPEQVTCHVEDGASFLKRSHAVFDAGHPKTASNANHRVFGLPARGGPVGWSCPRRT